MSKRSFQILFCIFSIYIIYGTTIPFDFTSVKVAIEKFNQLSWIPFQPIFAHGLLISDIVQNVLFFIPIGMFGILMFGNERKFIPIILIILYGFLLSTAVETIQLFLLTRNTSVTDIATNTIGTVAGVIITHLGMRLRIEEQIKILKRKENRLFLLILIVIFADKLYPFDLSLNISYMYSKLLNLQNSVTGVFAFNDNDIWNLMITAVFTYLAIESARLINKPIALSILLLSLMLPFCLEIAKIIVVSRNPDLHNVAITFLGIIIGLVAYLFFFEKRIYFGLLLISGIFISAVLKIAQPFRLETDNCSDYATYHSCNVMMNLSGYMGLFILLISGGFVIEHYLKKKVANRAATAIVIISLIVGMPLIKSDWVGAVVCIVAFGIGKGICGRLALQ